MLPASSALLVLLCHSPFLAADPEAAAPARAVVAIPADDVGALRLPQGGEGSPAPTPAPANPTAAGDPAATPSGSPVPEPATLLLVGTGLVGFALTSRHLRRKLRQRALGRSLG